MPKRKNYRKKRGNAHKRNTKFSKSDWALAKKLELKTGVHNFKEKIFDSITMNSDVNGNFFSATNFFYQDAPDYTSYTRIFKAYQICGVKIKYIIQNVDTSTGTTLDNLAATSNILTTHNTPSCVMVYSPTDSVTPTSMASLLETKGARLQRLNNGVISKYIRPKPLVKLYNGTLDTDYKIPNFNKNTWISTNESDLQHYALKEGWTGLNPNVVYQIQRVRTYYFKFKIPQ